jgi:lipopolysaccharide transport system ATP-binding protein
LVYEKQEDVCGCGLDDNTSFKVDLVDPGLTSTEFGRQIHTEGMVGHNLIRGDLFMTSISHTPSNHVLNRNETLTIFHITHQKAGSQWLHKILVTCAPEHIVRPEVGNMQLQNQPIQAGKIYPTLYVTREEFENINLPRHFYRFVVIRDLRDTMISAYFSMKVSHPVGGNISEVRSILQSLNQEDGLMWIMEQWLPRCARIQSSWLAINEPLIRYKDLLQNDLELLEDILLKRGKLCVSREKFEAAVLANRFEQVTGRQRGQEDITVHERKGIAGDWRNYFTEALKRSFKERYGDLLVATGYEKNQNW